MGYSDINKNFLKADQFEMSKLDIISKEEEEEKRVLKDLYQWIEKPMGFEPYVFNIMFVGVAPHVSMAYYFGYLLPFGIVPVLTLLPVFGYVFLAFVGFTVGTHRLWSHKTFKAKFPLQVILMLLQSAGCQYPIFKWCRDHRTHHKFTDTNADPHNSHRGFWFSYMGWLFQPEHPDVSEFSKKLDFSDLIKDPIVRFQSRYYNELVLVTQLIIPMSTCKYLFPEMSFVQLYTLAYAEYAVFTQMVLLLNALAHFRGNKPYDKDFSAGDSKFMSVFSLGESGHNYHHAFPWDYKTSEFGYQYNLSTMIIDGLAWMGWAYDLKTTKDEMVIGRVNRTGDGSHPLCDKKNFKIFVKKDC